MSLINYLNIDLNDIIILASSVHSFNDISKLIPKINLSNGLNTRRYMIDKINLPIKEKSLLYEMKTYMHDLFIKQDKMTMAHSIENRVPFTDNDLVEYSLSYLSNTNFNYSYLPNISKNTKIILKSYQLNILEIFLMISCGFFSSIFTVKIFKTKPRDNPL